MAKQDRMSSFNMVQATPEDLMHLDIQSISIISSCGCNLKCSYCVIAQSENKYTHQLQADTIKGLQDGSFLQNVVNSLLALNQSPAKIKMFSLWGQEPTLTIQYLTEHWEDWQKAFPNIEKIFFSTNGMAYGERIVDFVKAVDKFATKNIGIQIQFSYDGEFSTNNIRNASSIQIKENARKVIEALNPYRLQKADVMFCFHGVMSQALIETLTSGEITQEYYNQASSWVADLVAVNENRNVKVEPGVGFIFEAPIDASAEQGIELAAWYKKMIKVNPKYVTNDMGNIEAHSILTAYQRAYRGIQNCKYNSYKEMIKQIVFNEAEMQHFLDFFSRSSFCGTFYGELKIMHDGTIIGCQNSMYEQHPDVIKNDGSIKNGAKLALAEHQTFFVHPLNDDIQHIYDVFNIFRANRESSFMFTYTNTVNLMLWMLEAHQIDESYRDIEKLLTHSFYLTLLSACVYNNYIQTGTFYGISTGMIRYMCNGFLDCVLDNDEVWGGVKFD